MTWRVNFVRSKDAQKQLARTSLRMQTLKVVYFCINRKIKIAEAVDGMMGVYVVVKNLIQVKIILT